MEQITHVDQITCILCNNVWKTIETCLNLDTHSTLLHCEPGLVEINGFPAITSYCIWSVVIFIKGKKTYIS